LAETTVLLRTIVESQTYDLGLKSYPIYKEEHREELNKKILEHFYFHEIGFETIPLFIRRLNAVLAEIMPKYNQLYSSADIEFNPLYNVELHETFEHEATGSSGQNMTANSDSTDKQLSIGSDTPSESMQTQDIQADEYASQANKSNATTNVKNVNNYDNTSSNNENYTKTTIGSSAGFSFSYAIRELRKNILNIDEMLLEDKKLNNLFLSVYSL